jgi:hypothetical protein
MAQNSQCKDILIDIIVDGIKEVDINSVGDVFYNYWGDELWDRLTKELEDALEADSEMNVVDFYDFMRDKGYFEDC